MGQTRGGQIGRTSNEPEQIASTSPLTQRHWQSARPVTGVMPISMETVISIQTATRREVFIVTPVVGLQRASDVPRRAA
jgi:hypothetical protein